ncbi:MAG TPA: hypothetical protein VHB27_16665 [Rhodopila sp.]|uniref:sulfotransferase family protein n=1 Tax=Rhodopila sp. TaxID=2480087 RepID=UPI002BB9DB79|nr:hypothetical protein [Rhodopila sp.]HVY16857.1 hypothetical protein [Rhodopila sp.]
MPKGRRRAIVILGMHRSGTSAVAGTTVCLGAAAPRTPLDVSDDNPAGYYESDPIVHHNHTMMKAAGAAWNLCLHLDAYAISENAPAFQAASARLLAEEFGDAPLFVLKDPRLCMTFPAWLPVIRGAGIDISVLLVVRHPVEVVRSLSVRNNLPETESMAQWLHHVLEAERVSRGLPRAVVFYHDVLANWRLAMQWAGQLSGITWPRTVQEAGAAVDRFLAGELRHHRTRQGDTATMPTAIVPWAQTTWNMMSAMRDDADDPACLRALDSVHAAFADWRREVYPPDLKLEIV